MGDVVHEDADGWLYFDHRKGSGIRRNGDFINTAFIEKAIAESGLVDDVYVYGIPSARAAPARRTWSPPWCPRMRTRSTRSSSTPSAATRLEANFVPGFVQVLAQIPKTASEKPQERFLVEAFEARPESVHRPVAPVR